MVSKSFIPVSLLILITSCTTPGPAGLFGTKSPHDAYAEKIKNAGLNETALGIKWLSAGEHAIGSPLLVTLPYSETGYFAAEEPGAAGLQFHAIRGEKLTITVNKTPAGGWLLFLDVWEPGTAANSKPRLLLSADTSSGTVEYAVDKEGIYMIRLQPELLRSGNYTLSISTGPSLAFPIAPKAKSTIGSFWGAGRDAGTRKHEGIDILAPRGTAVVAAANGVVARVDENKLGGKVVFMTTDNKEYNLYYAHLDKQLAEPGQRVTAGDTLGLVGNTGNAITTVPHLHFGIYTFGGAIDPLPFVNRTIKTPVKITASLFAPGKWSRNAEPVKLSNEPSTKSTNLPELPANTLLKVQAATADRYKVLLPGGEEGFVSNRRITVAETPLRKMDLHQGQPLLNEPNEFAPKKTLLPSGKTISILAFYKDYYYVMDQNIKGWIPKNAFF